MQLVIAIAFASIPMVAVSTLVGPLIEIPVMLTLVSLALRRRKRAREQKEERGKNAIVPNGAILSFFVTVVSQNLLLTKTFFVFCRSGSKL
jgi:hypothetical protein